MQHTPQASTGGSFAPCDGGSKKGEEEGTHRFASILRWVLQLIVNGVSLKVIGYKELLTFACFGNSAPSLSSSSPDILKVKLMVKSQTFGKKKGSFGKKKIHPSAPTPHLLP